MEKLIFISPGAAPDAIRIAVDGIQSLAVDPHGRLVLATTLGDIVFTAPIAYQEVNGRRRAVDVASTYIGTQNFDRVQDIAVDEGGHIVAIGQAGYGSDNAITGYLARFNADLTTRQAYLSYYPGSASGSSRIYFNDVAVGENFVVAVGQTYMDDLPATPGAFDTDCGTDGVCDGVGSLLVPKPDGFDRSYNGGTSDAFVSVFDTAGGGTGGGGGVPPGNVAPVADAGEDQTAGPRQRVYLDGRASSDPDGQIVHYHWTQSAGKAISIRNADSDLADFTSPRVRRGATQTLEFQLEVTDNRDATAVDRVTIQVTR